MNNLNPMNMNNAMDMNIQMNMMMNLMNDYMNNLATLYNNMKNNMNNNLKNNNNMIIVSDKNKFNSKKTVLPEKVETVSHTVFPEIPGDRIYIVFQTTTGHKVIMNVPIKLKFGELMLQYGYKVGVGPKVIEEKVHFLFNGRRLKNEDKDKTPSELGILNLNSIIVVDIQNVIGAIDFLLGK